MWYWTFKYEPERGPHRWLLHTVRANTYQVALMKFYAQVGDCEILECERCK